jgi:hypothetical protein
MAPPEPSVTSSSRRGGTTFNNESGYHAYAATGGPTLWLHGAGSLTHILDPFLPVFINGILLSAGGPGTNMTVDGDYAFKTQLYSQGTLGAWPGYGGSSTTADFLVDNYLVIDHSRAVHLALWVQAVCFDWA